MTIENHEQYQEEVQRCLQDDNRIRKLRADLLTRGLTKKEADYALQPIISFYAKYKDEVRDYEDKHNLKCMTDKELANYGLDQYEQGYDAGVRSSKKSSD